MFETVLSGRRKPRPRFRVRGEDDGGLGPTRLVNGSEVVDEVEGEWPRWVMLVASSGSGVCAVGWERRGGVCSLFDCDRLSCCRLFSPL